MRFVTFILLIAIPAIAQEPQGPEPVAPNKDVLLKQLATPGEHHKELDILAGNWKLGVKWRAAPDDKWSESQGSAEYQWILGRRFLQESLEYDMGDDSLEWLGVYGYDNYQRKFTAVWVDNMGTNTEFATAVGGPQRGGFIFEGQQDDPLTGGKRKFRWIITIVSKDRLRFDSFDESPTGKFFKNTEVTATRVPTNDK